MAVSLTGFSIPTDDKIQGTNVSLVGFSIPIYVYCFEIVDEGGNPLSGATITISGITETYTTDANGVANVGITSGTVTVSVNNYDDVTQAFDFAGDESTCITIEMTSSFVDWYGVNPLPLYYEYTNTKYPTNTTDDIDTVSSFSSNNGYLQIDLVTTYETYVKGEFIEITNSANYDGVHRIKEVVDSDTIVLFTSFIAIDVGNVQRYYKNYFTVFRVYVGILSDNARRANNVLTELGSIRLRPDANNLASGNIAEYVRSELVPILNDISDADLPNAWQEWATVRIVVEEEYDTVDSAGLIETYNSGVISTLDDSNCVNGNLQPQNTYGNRFADYALRPNDGGGLRKFMTMFETPTHFKNYPFTLSIIAPKFVWLRYGDTLGNPDLQLFITEYDVNGNSLGNTVGKLSDLDSDTGDLNYGLYRIQPDDYITFNSSTSYYTVYIRENGGNIQLSETKTINYEQNPCPYPYCLQWINHLGGFDTWLFTGIKDYMMDTSDVQTMKRDIFDNQITSYINATTEHDVIEANSREGKKVRSRDLTDNELDGVRECLRSIKVTQWDELSGGTYTGRTVIVQKGSVQYKTDRPEINEIEFEVMDTFDRRIQRQ